MKVVICGTDPAHEARVLESFILGYESNGDTWLGTSSIRIESISNSLSYAKENAYSMVVRSTIGSQEYLNTSLIYYPDILTVMPAGSNSPVLVFTEEIPQNMVITGAGDTENETGYRVEFFANDPISDPHDYSSYANGYIAGQLACIMDNNAGSGSWDARYRARMTGSNLGVWHYRDGYGNIDVASAIAYAGTIIEDPFLADVPEDFGIPLDVSGSVGITYKTPIRVSTNSVDSSVIVDTIKFDSPSSSTGLYFPSSVLNNESVISFVDDEIPGNVLSIGSKDLNTTIRGLNTYFLSSGSVELRGSGSVSTNVNNFNRLVVDDLGINVSGSIRVSNVDISTVGALPGFAYKGQDNNFTSGQTVNGDTFVYGSLTNSLASYSTSFVENTFFRIYNNPGKTEYSQLRIGQIETNKMFIEAHNQADTKGSLILAPYGTGYVGIRNTSPTEALDVTGNIIASGSITAPTINATTSIQLNNNDINTSGTLSNVPYLNKANTFTQQQTFSASIILNASAGAGIATTQGEESFATGRAWISGGNGPWPSIVRGADIILAGREYSGSDAAAGSIWIRSANNAGSYIEFRAKGSTTNIIRIDDTGRMGIANTTPAEKLDVDGNIKASGMIGAGGTAAISTLQATFGARTSSTDNTKGIRIRNTDGDRSFLLGVGLSELESKSFFIRDITSGKYPFVIDQTNSRIGIYNTSPSEVLDITGNIKASGSINAETALQVNGTDIFSRTNTWSNIQTFSNNIIMNTAGGVRTIFGNTTDTSTHTGELRLTSADGVMVSKSGYIMICGNAHATYPGNVRLVCGTGGLIQSSGNTEIAGTLSLNSTARIFRMGPDSDGSWQFAISGGNLVIQKKESGTWTTKGTF